MNIYGVVAPGQSEVSFHAKHKPCDCEPIEDINDPYVQELGRFAVMEYKIVGVELKFVRVVSGETLKVPEGKKYSLMVEVKEEIIDPCESSAMIKIYVAVVMDKQCDRSWKLESFDPLKVQHSARALI